MIACSTDTPPSPSYTQPVPRPHLLYVAWGFPPCRGAGVYRALATANAFAEAGWSVTVLTAPREVFYDYYGADRTLEALIHPSIRVRRVRQPLPLKEFDLAAYSRLRVTSESAWSSATRRLQTIPFPEQPYGSWRKNLESAALLVHRESPVDLTIGTSNPHVDFLPGRLLHKRFGVPYVMDYRDAWSLDVESGRRASSPDSRAWRIEHDLLEHAFEAWFVNEPIRSWYEGAAPEIIGRTRVVMNGYDGDVGSMIDATRRRSKQNPATDPDSPLTFGFLGSIYGATPLAEALAGWRRARELSPELARARFIVRGHLGHYGQPDESYLSEVARYATDSVSYRGPVGRASVAEVYAGFDVLVLPLRGGRYITSGKVFEYAATGLPIVSIHDTDLHAAKLMRVSPTWTICETLSPDDIAAALIRGAEFARRSTGASVRAGRRWAYQFSRELQLRPAVEAANARVGHDAGLQVDQEETRSDNQGTGAPVSTRATGAGDRLRRRPIDGRHGPQRSVVVLLGSHETPDWHVLRPEMEDSLAVRLGNPGRPADVTLVCRQAPSSPVDGVARVHVVSGDGSLMGHLARSDLYQALDAWLKRSAPGRILASLLPTDTTRTFDRAIRRDATALSLAHSADLVVAGDRPAVRAAWSWLRAGVIPAAVYGLAAAERRARSMGAT